MLTKSLTWLKTHLALGSALLVLILGGSGYSVVSVVDGMIERSQRIHQLEDTAEMMFHFCRAMTDNDNPYRYHITTGSGRREKTYEVDVRNNNEGDIMAFVYDLWRYYPINIDIADSTRWTIKLHDYRRNETHVTELIRD
jgi:hypothetical protein